jgi:hypothetical protein
MTIDDVVQKTEDGRYVVAWWDERKAQWLAPMNAREKALSGGKLYVARHMKNLGVHSYSTRSAAVRFARSEGLI